MPIRSLQPTRWLAQRLGLSVSTIERLRARGDRNLPPHVVIGPQTIRYDEAVVEAWLEARMQASAGEMPVVKEAMAAVPSSPPSEALRRWIGKGRVVPAVASAN